MFKLDEAKERQLITRLHSIKQLKLFLTFDVFKSNELFFSREHATLEPTVSIGPTVRRSVTFLFSAPAHPSATWGECIRPFSYNEYLRFIEITLCTNVEPRE